MVAISTRGVYLCHQCHVRGEYQQPWTSLVGVRVRFDGEATYLDTRLASQATLEVHQATTDLVAHGRLAVLSGVHSLAASSGGTSGGSALGS